MNVVSIATLGWWIPLHRATQKIIRSLKNRIYCFGVGVAAAFPGVGEAFGSFRASLRVSRPFLRASTRVRRRVFFSGDGEGDALSIAAPFAGLGLGSGSAAKTLDCAIKPMAAARRRMCFIIIISGLSFKLGSFFPLKPGQPMLF